jgi:transposase
MTTVTVLSSPERRRRWTSAEKARIVDESLAAEASVAEVARRFDVHPNQLHLWRRQARLGIPMSGRDAGGAGEGAARFVPVAVAMNGGVGAKTGIAAIVEPVIEVVLRNGRMLRLPEGVAPARAANLADALEGCAQ